MNFYCIDLFFIEEVQISVWGNENISRVRIYNILKHLREALELMSAYWILKKNETSHDQTLSLWTFLDKIISRNINRNQAQLNKTTKLWYLLYHNFRPFLPKNYFWKGNWFFLDQNFFILLIFSNFLRF